MFHNAAKSSGLSSLDIYEYIRDSRFGQLLYSAAPSKGDKHRQPALKKW